MEEYIRKWKELENSGKKVYFEKGKLLSEVRRKIPYGEWGVYLDKIGIKQRVATRLIRMYKVFNSHEKLTSLDCISQCKLDVLARLNEKQLSDFIDNHINDIEASSVRDLENIVRNIIRQDNDKHDVKKVTITLSESEVEILKYVTDKMFPNKKIHEVCSIIVSNFAQQIINMREKNAS